MLLFAAFIGILLISFSAIAFVMRTTPEQKAVDRRIAIIKASGVDAALDSGALGNLLKVTKTGSFGWLEKPFTTYAVAQKLQLLLLQAKTTTTIGSLLAASVGLATVGGFICYLFMPVAAVALIAAAIVGYIPLGTVLIRRSKRIAAFNAALPESIDMMSRALRAGHSLVASLSIIAEQSIEPAKSEFAEVFKQQNYGLPLRDALMQLLDRVPSQDLRVFVTGVMVQKDTGGNLAEILDRIVFVIRERLRIQGEIRTHTAQGRLTGWILCLLPVVMMFLINVINPGYSKILFDDPVGRKLLYTGIGLLVVGGLIIRHIINGIEV